MIPPHAPADVRRMQEVLREAGVDQTVEPASWQAWLEAALEALVGAVEASLDRLTGGLPSGSIETLAWVVVALLAAALAILLVRALAAWRSRRPRDVSVPRARHEPATSSSSVDWSAEAWARLERGDARGALEAAWWWLASSLVEHPDPTATTREVVVGARRRDLLSLASRLDRLTYGAGEPDRAHVAELLHGMRGGLA